MRQLFVGIILVLATTNLAWSGKAAVLEATAESSGDRQFRFIVTVAHADQGWNHYADRWEILTPEGQLLATRTLYHPHVDEQPFTRQIDGVSIPPTVSTVIVRAHDSVHGYGGDQVEIKLPEN